MMEKINNNITKRLQDLVKNRKISRVIIKQGSIKYPSRNTRSGSDSFSGYSSSELE